MKGSRRSLGRRGPWLVASGSLLAALAVAADRPFVPQRPLLNKEELQACTGWREQLDAHHKALESQRADVDSQAAAVEKEGLELERQRPGVDPGSREFVGMFNEKIDRHRQRVDAYNAQVGAFNAEVNSLNADESRFDKRCGNRFYYPSDMDDLTRDRKQRKKTGTGLSA